jgi:hypothetical protein
LDQKYPDEIFVGPQDADHRDEIIAHWQERMAEEDWKHRDLMGFSAV